MSVAVNAIGLDLKPTINVRALYLSERINVRNVRSETLLSKLPLTFRAGEGCAVIFRYGAVVLFSVGTDEEKALLERLKDSLVGPFKEPATDEVEIRVDAGIEEGYRQDAIIIKEITLDRLQLIAEALAKSLVLEHYEASISQNVDIAESLILHLKQKGYVGLRSSDLLQQISGSLLSLQEMAGFVGVSDKPELLWEHPEHERFYARLEDEYEIRERHIALDKKAELIFRTAQTLMNLLQTRRSLRVEWYIVILILVEVFIILYQMVSAGH